MPSRKRCWQGLDSADLERPADEELASSAEVHRVENDDEDEVQSANLS